MVAVAVADPAAAAALSQDILASMASIVDEVAVSVAEVVGGVNALGRRVPWPTSPYQRG